ncbi:MAG: AmmeMemoRadiSam system protein B [Armatimonadetes bacterium]|nr:AmmeMemoRadiSam system protein B [Armatimonadota bacterium]
MSIVFWGISPHPPLLIPEIGNLMLKEVANTKAALKDLSKKLINSAPQVLILITPHGPVFMDKISILGKEEIQGDFSNFGCPQVSLKFKIEQNLKELILEEAKEASIPLIKLEIGRSVNLDHAQLVPLFYFKEAGLNIPLVSISIGMLSYLELYNFGGAIQKAAEKSNLRVALVSSGDLSHRLKPGAPAGYDSKGKIFDELLIKYLKEMNIKSILEIDPELIERAGECGLRPIIILLGSIFNKKVKSKVLSYEGPFGVGYAVVSIEEV